MRYMVAMVTGFLLKIRCNDSDVSFISVVNFTLMR